MKKKYSLTSLLIFTLVLLLYNLLIFIIPYPNKYNSIFWISWLFGLISLTTYPIVDYYITTKDNDLKSIMYKIPLIKANIITITIQLITTILFIILNSFINIALWILIIIEVIIVLLTVVSLLSSDKYIKVIEKQEVEAKEQIKFNSSILTEINNLLIICNNKDIKNKLEELYEVVRYSDPVSSSYSKDIEDNITLEVNKLKDIINDRDNIIISINEIIILFKTRNNIIKANKGK